MREKKKEKEKKKKKKGEKKKKEKTRMRERKKRTRIGLEKANEGMLKVRKKGVGVNMPEKYANVLFYLYKKELAVYHFGMSTKSPFISGPLKLAHGRCLLVLINFLRARVVLLMLEKDFESIYSVVS